MGYIHLPLVLLLFWWSVAPPGGGTPTGPWESPPSPPSYCWYTISPTVPTPYTLLPRPAMFLPSFSSPLLSLPSPSNIYAGFGRPPPNRCYCRQLSILALEKPLTVVESPRLSETKPYLPRRGVAGSCVWYAFPLPARIFPMCSGRF